MLAAAVNFDAGAPRIKQPGRPFAQVAGIIESWKLFKGWKLIDSWKLFES